MNQTAWNIEPGYKAGLLGRIVSLHANYYIQSGQFGPDFESQVAGELAEFFPRLSAPQNQIWSIVRDGQIEGSVSIDGQHLGGNRAHLRWFIISDVLRGRGVGGALMKHAMDHVDQQGFGETRLWTFTGLNAARRLYERQGFILREEYEGDQWGRNVREQLWVRMHVGKF
ncbi:MAG: GNAT family N-acetyltransferase [Rhodobacteraceae bacterium]|nr:GNAT family N-acetyltransferase [Paracoccaceae bacterium]